MNPGFWNGRRVLVTGHTGFKGSWLCLWLQRMGAQVSGFALAPETSPNLFEQAHVGSGMDSEIGDIRELPALQQHLDRTRPEVVLHLAAQALVRPSYQFPVETFATNVQGTVHLLEAVRQQASVRSTVIVTSDKCYENREWIWPYRESDPMGGHDPYSCSKGCAELVSASYRRSFFSKTAHQGLATARAGNVIGGGDWSADRLIPDLMQALAEGRSPEIRNPLAVRPWQHVLEPLSGYLLLAEKLFDEPAAFSEGWNFGPDLGATLTVGEIADRILQLWPDAPAWSDQSGDHPHEAQSLTLDSSMARLRLHWHPCLPISEALEWTANWYRAFKEGQDMREASLTQIDQYQTRAQGDRLHAQL